jgi:glycosyltransferase involved in cell wall biosynthesis
LLVIGGRGNDAYEARLRAESSSLAISDAVVWVGFLTGREKASAFAAASVFVLPSYSENFGIAAAEALAAGIPTILCEGVAMADYAIPARAAFVVRPDVTELRNAIEQLLVDPTLRAELTRNGPALVAERFSMHSVGAALKDLYLSIVPAARA